ncbi:MAG TPA: twin-arginine translocation signal domain-containing protein [Gemmatimonadales bacterium]|mgnify:CR=1 FL=1|jgi:hypothetical protein|nr:twin-arginine translocation signal domain-containing protein [Gemmatimonadales bacterium]
MSEFDPTSRRDFMTMLGLSGVALAASACAPAVAPTSPAPSPTAAPPQGAAPAQAAAAPAPARPARPIVMPPTSADAPFDLRWLDRLASVRYKLVFDIGAYANGGGLFYAKNYLNGMRDGWGIQSPDVVPLLGISGDAYPIVFNDAIWAKYKYGESSKTTDVRTGLPAVRNVFWEPKAGEPMAEFGVDVLQRRGAQLFLCNNVFRGVIRRVMSSSGRPYDEVRAELVAGFLPGVTVVPAMVAAMAMAQMQGAGYVYAGA